MPVGVIVDALAVVIGGIVGAVVGKKLKKDFIDNMNLILGCCSMCMGVSTIVLMQHMPAVVFAIILGTGLGLAVHFGKLINKGGLALQKGISRFVKTSSDVSEAEFEATLVTCITLFCASGTGIYGSIIAGMSADHSVLIAKAILDLFTAVVFACTLGMVTAAVAIPQFIIFFILFLLGAPIYNGLDLGTNTYIINDFKACGGFIMLATGFRMCKIKQFPVADMIPAMVLIFPIAIFWNDCVTPAVNMLAGIDEKKTGCGNQRRQRNSTGDRAAFPASKNRRDRNASCIHQRRRDYGSAGIGTVDGRNLRAGRRCL